MHSLRSSRPVVRILVLLIVAVLFTGTTVLVFAGGQGEAPAAPRYRIALVLPDRDGTDPYREVRSGVRRAVEEREGVALEEQLADSPEALAEQLKEIAEAGRVDLLVTAGQAAAQAVPQLSGELRVLLIDGVVVDDPRVRSIGINHREAAFLAGYTAGLVFEDLERAAAGVQPGAEAQIPGARSTAPRVTIVTTGPGALVNGIVEPAFRLGLHSPAPHVAVDILPIQPQFSTETIRRVIREKHTDAFFVLADEVGEALVSEMSDHGAYVLWHNRYGGDTPNSSFLTEIGLALEEASYRRVSSAIDGILEFGRLEVLSLADNELEVTIEARRLPGDRRDEIRRRFEEMRDRLMSGELELLIPRHIIVD
jgi:basic membrane lipoprotein Med (substrate-binding protein (PBP1-ABC) superfamily)